MGCALTLEPSPQAWAEMLARGGAPDPDLRACAAEQAVRLGGAAPEPAGPVVTSGHQPGFWHPGILAKAVAGAMAARAHGAGRLWLVVDHEPGAPLELPWPEIRGERLFARVLRLHAADPEVPTGCQPPVAPQALAARAEALDAGPWAGALARMVEALSEASGCRSLAEQVAVAAARLAEPWAGRWPLLFVQDLARVPAFASIVQAVIGEAGDCVAAYNAAVAGEPDAGVRPLVRGAGRAELPLWAVAWGKPRQPVWVEEASGRLLDGAGRSLEAGAWRLLPRALLLSAAMRRLVPGLFVHGRGGGRYDRLTDAWWQAWRGEPLAGRAVVSADLTLPLHVPVAEPAEWIRARWYAHHLPHNLDRELGLQGPEVERKRRRLATMDADRDPVRRRAGFEEIHRVNRALAEAHPEALEAAAQALARAEAGVANRHVARRRDWPFPLYPPEALEGLRETARHRLEAPAAEAPCHG